jgi:hypothetical protein
MIRYATKDSKMALILPKIKKLLGSKSDSKRDVSTNCQLEINENQKTYVSSNLITNSSEADGDKILYGQKIINT